MSIIKESFNFLALSGTLIRTGWQGESVLGKLPDSLSGGSNAYTVGQNKACTLGYTFTDGLYGKYVFRIYISGQGNGYVKNLKVQVTYISGETETVYTNSGTLNSLDQTFNVNAKQGVKSIIVSNTTASNGSLNVAIQLELSSWYQELNYIPAHSDIYYIRQGNRRYLKKEESTDGIKYWAWLKR